MDLSTNNSTTDLIINLDQSDKNSPIHNTRLIQRRRYEELKYQIKDHLDTLDPESLNVPYPAGSGWVLFVDGTRGAGKSTFLNSVERNLTEDSSIKSRPAFVALIDPSRIERSEIILLTILQHLNKKIKKVLGAERTIQYETTIGEWQRTFRQVAGGLTLFAKEHHPLNDLDADLFLDWGLERAGDSANLRSNLHKLFENACTILKAKAIMIAFDDADTDATHAINLLECIRKYLDTPQVMVLVTGDMELYSLLVRQHFTANLMQRRDASTALDRIFMGNDRSEQFIRMVEHLEEQYLLKLFPVRRRLQLLPMQNLIRQAKEEGWCYRVALNAWGENKPEVHELVREIVSRGLRIKSSYDIALYREFLLEQPLRSVLQVLSHCAPFIAKPDEGAKENKSFSRKLTEAACRSFQALALTNLYKFSIDVDAITAHDLPALSEAVFNLSLLDGDVDTAAYLRPMSAQHDIKNCFMALAAEVPNFSTGKPGLLIRYLLSGPGSVTLYDLVRKRQPSNSAGSSASLDRQFRQFMGIGRKDNALDWARRATAIIATPYAVNPTFRVVRIGVIGLNRKRPSNTGKNESTARTAIGNALLHDSISNLPTLALSLVDVSGSGIRTYASIFHVIGLIERLLELETLELDDIKNALGKAYPTVSISSPPWEAGNIADERTEHETDDEAQHHEGMNTNMAFTGLAEKIRIWLIDVKSLAPKVSPSGILVGKIWTRLFFSLEKASDDMRGKGGVADLMEIFALCVVNAFLVEEADHHIPGDIAKLERSNVSDRTNPVQSPSAFVKKLEGIVLSRDDMPLTTIVATCPLLLNLLNVDAGYAEKLRALFPDAHQDLDEIKSLMCSESLWTPFNEISIAGRSRKVASTPTKPRRAKKQGDDITNDLT